jgi:hypothetical protein
MPFSLKKLFLGLISRIFHGLRPNTREENAYMAKEKYDDMGKEINDENKLAGIFVRDIRWRKLKLPKDYSKRYDTVANYFMKKGFNKDKSHTMARLTYDCWVFGSKREKEPGWMSFLKEIDKNK